MDFLLALHQLVLPKLRAGNSSLDGTNLAQATISICYKNMCVPFGIWDLEFGNWGASGLGNLTKWHQLGSSKHMHLLQEHVCAIWNLGLGIWDLGIVEFISGWH